jgi:hypothetical protein
MLLLPSLAELLKLEIVEKWIDTIAVLAGRKSIDDKNLSF